MRVIAVTALVALAIGGCGGSDDSPSAGAVPGAGQGGTLTGRSRIGRPSLTRCSRTLRRRSSSAARSMSRWSRSWVGLSTTRAGSRGSRSRSIRRATTSSGASGCAPECGSRTEPRATRRR